MAVRYSSGAGRLYDKETAIPIAQIKYQLTELDEAQFFRGKWWGEFSTNRAMKLVGNYIIEIIDGRKGECLISTDTQEKKGVSRYYFHFNGRGRLGTRSSKRK